MGIVDEPNTIEKKEFFLDAETDVSGTGGTPQFFFQLIRSEKGSTILIQSYHPTQPIFRQTVNTLRLRAHGMRLV